MQALKIFGGLAAFAILLFAFIAKSSSVESRFECNGRITNHESNEPATIALKIQKYRWWVSLWSASRGYVWIEVPNRDVHYFEHVNQAGDLLRFRKMESQLSGIFSTLSGAVGVSLGGATVFEGSCKKISQISVN